ncbi:MAG: glutathione S-transferase family protein [Alphaproteobacteria bacterium]
MGILVNGQWQVDEVYPRDATGSIIRVPSQLRHWITPDGAAGPSGEGGFAAEAGRYHLYIAIVCPWAHRTRIFRTLKKLDGIVSMSVCAPWREDKGWEFAPDQAEFRDHLFNARYMHEIYTHAKPDYTGRVTVPVLWDKQRKTIVNNESSEIIRMFNAAFNRLTGDTKDYYPSDLRAEIDAWNERIYKTLNNGVYRAGNAASQQAHEEAVLALFATLDAIEAHLATNRYLCGDRLTEADWRLFPTLVRFDACYNGVMKCNLRRLVEYPNLSAYTRELFQMPGIAESVNVDYFKLGYYGNRERNPSGIVPIGPIVDFTSPHRRERLKAA